VRPVIAALIIACVPGRARADGLCVDSIELLAGDSATCDGVLVGPDKLGELLEHRAKRQVCELELGAERKRSVIDRRGCDERISIMAAEVDHANARADRFPWAHVWGALLLGVVVGAVSVGAMVAR
jgi:hypothetical protein